MMWKRYLVLSTTYLVPGCARHEPPIICAGRDGGQRMFDTKDCRELCGQHRSIWLVNVAAQDSGLWHDPVWRADGGSLFPIRGDNGSRVVAGIASQRAKPGNLLSAFAAA